MRLVKYKQLAGSFYPYQINNIIIQGGESTQDEMCVSFLMYYPAIDLGACSSQTTFNSFLSFAQQYIE